MEWAQVLAAVFEKILNLLADMLTWGFGYKVSVTSLLGNSMTTGICVDPLARKIARDAIAAYKTYISPRKGFACAHRLVHGGESCSTYIKHLLGQESLMSAVQLSRQRFKACAAASYTLKATTSSSGGCIVIPCCLPI